MRNSGFGRTWRGVTILLVLSGTMVRRCHAVPVTIDTPLGPRVVDIGHVGPEGHLVTPGSPTVPSFGPPTVFSAPLPAGSGARAIGVAGAFTAVADDATAASWNPGGLTQLERPEASVVVRASREQNSHTSSNPDFVTGEDEFESLGLNYLSVVWPFRCMQRNWVFSMNYQEAYDFEQRFTATAHDNSSQRHRSTSIRTDEGVQDQRFAEDDGVYQVDMEVRSYLTTHTRSALEQVLASSTESDTEFSQEGIIDAVSPALAVELTPKIAIGTAVNFYGNDHLTGNPIVSRTRARFSGVSSSRTALLTTRTTDGYYEGRGVVSRGGEPIAEDSFGGTFTPFTDSSQTSSRDEVAFDGVYEERNRYDDLEGVNATFGVVVTVNRFFGFGVMCDTAWRAEAVQTRSIHSVMTTHTVDRSRTLDTTVFDENSRKRVEFNFPLFWSAGAVARWTDRWHSTLDVSQTQWSDFWYRAEGGARVNPLDGTVHGLHRIDDCYAVRVGNEYLVLFPKTEVPLRCGLSWEQRPAIGSPDEFWGVSLGTGIAIGQDPGRLILDVAYIYSWGDNVLGSLVPDQEGMSTDVSKHQGFVSAIWHF